MGTWVELYPLYFKLVICSTFQSPLPCFSVRTCLCCIMFSHIFFMKVRPHVLCLAGSVLTMICDCLCGHYGATVLRMGRGVEMWSSSSGWPWSCLVCPVRGCGFKIWEIVFNLYTYFEYPFPKCMVLIENRLKLRAFQDSLYFYFSTI